MSTHRNWKTELIKIVEQHGGKAALKNKQVSSATKDVRKNRLIVAFRMLRSLGYKIDNPNNLSEKHIQALADYLVREEKSASYIQNIISTLRVFCLWIGKPHMIKGMDAYAPGIKRSYAADTDKSWVGKGIDVDAIINMISAKDRFVGMQLRAAKIFGLRRREAILLKPIKDAREEGLYVVSGTKGGRARMVPVETAEQKAMLKVLQVFCAENGGRLVAPGLRVDQAIERYNYMLKCFGLTKLFLGVTGHGLRHQFAIESLERKGFIAPVRLGAGQSAVIASVEDNTHAVETLEQARLQVSEELGHSRLNITTAYYGKFPSQRMGGK